MIIVTGGAGFIGSAMIWKLNEENYDDILVADHLGTGNKWLNLAKRRVSRILHKDDLTAWLDSEADHTDIEAVFHIGARSATTERDVDFLMRNNLGYSVDLFRFCSSRDIPFIYASSAATYGNGENGFSDDPDLIPGLRPINPYGFSKQLFDDWVIRQQQTPPFWAGLKFFNVYGPQEYHKGPQASVPFHLFPQVGNEGSVRLFKSYRDGIAHGDQKRDFVYVKDVVDVMWHLFQARERASSGIFNVGAGVARTFMDLGKAVFSAMDAGNAKVDWIEMPADLQNQYQYFTEAELGNLRAKTGYERPFTSLEDGIADYLCNYLMTDDPYL